MKAYSNPNSTFNGWHQFCRQLKQ